MTTLFGYRLDPDFDVAKERRRDHWTWAFFGGLALWCLYLWSDAFNDWTERPFLIEILQGWIATSLFYGDNFYIRRGGDLRKPWLWKAVIAVTPIHVLYLAAIFLSDRAFPQVMRKIAVFLPVLALGFAIESIKLQRLIDHFKPAACPDPEPQTTETN